jgi:LIVCS family branched-chain amino acid:cation transporter
MKHTKTVFVYGFAVFAAFFGAGNLILPPYLGFNSGPDWWLSALGFFFTATIIPLGALMAYSRLQGTMLDFGNKVSRSFSLVLCVLIYVIAVLLPCPRTAAVTHEMAIAPFFDTSPLLTSGLYFAFATLFSLNRGKVMDLLGKYLTPIIGLILMAIIGIKLFVDPGSVTEGQYEKALVSGFLEGYQTYDALAGLLMGGVLVMTIQNSRKGVDFEQKKQIITGSSLVAMSGLFLIYAGLIYAGSRMGGLADVQIERTSLLRLLAETSLGETGSLFLSLLVGVACFTTAVGILVGTADFFKGLFKDSEFAYRTTVVIGALIGVLVGQLDVRYIINVAIPVLMFLYPIVITLIVLNVVPQKWASPLVFRTVVLTAFVFSIPDFIGVLLPDAPLASIQRFVPLAKDGLGWILPTLISFLGVNLFLYRANPSKAG